jgi:hypothetical protein
MREATRLQGGKKVTRTTLSGPTIHSGRDVEGVVFFKEIGQSHRSNKILHLSL